MNCQKTSSNFSFIFCHQLNLGDFLGRKRFPWRLSFAITIPNDKITITTDKITILID